MAVGPAQKKALVRGGGGYGCPPERGHADGVCAAQRGGARDRSRKRGHKVVIAGPPAPATPGWRRRLRSGSLIAADQACCRRR
jgi:hypothetical protein